MDWFERLTGFPEAGYDDTRSHLVVDGRELRSLVNGRSYGIGELELVSLQTLRDRVAAGSGPSGRLAVRNISGDVRQLHRSSEYGAALFQVASQFNLLEMTSYTVTPEHGVTRYQGDPTQGPACAIAAGAATIYRNYFVPVSGGFGQTAHRQLDGLADIGAALSQSIGVPVKGLWVMRNGYALGTQEGLTSIGAHLHSLSASEIDTLRGLLRIGLHQDVEVTDIDGPQRRFVSQAFCSALPIAYCSVPPTLWQPFAELVLEAAYEATLWAGVLNARRGASNKILLTRLGGGAFGNEDGWITAAMRRALTTVNAFDLDIVLVSHGSPPPPMLALAAKFD